MEITSLTAPMCEFRTLSRLTARTVATTTADQHARNGDEHE